MSRYAHWTWPSAAALVFLISGCAHSNASPAAQSWPSAPLSPTAASLPAEPAATSNDAASAAVPRTTLSQDEEVEAGRNAAQYLRRTVGLVEDPALQTYVQRVGAAVAAQCERSDLPWTFAVLDDPAPNAFALPGGVVFVTRGMLSHLDSEAELAALLGHEIAHVAARHAIQVLGQQPFPQLGGTPAGASQPVAAGAHLDGGLGLLFRQYGRQAERQADALGFDYALAAGYDVREMEDIFIVMDRRARHSQTTPVPDFLATHPPTQERVALVRARFADAAVPDDLVVGRDAFLERIDGLVYGPDPRQGFFHGTRFFHFAHRYVLRLPTGWLAQNVGRIVVATSPDGAAMIHFGVVNATPAAAEERLLSLPGVEGKRVSSEPIGGLEARVVSFRIETESGPRDGMAAFIEHAGRTHEILGLASTRTYGRHGLEIVSSISSFTALADVDLEAVQPLRIRVERLTEAMSVAAFAQRYPSALSVDELVILNQAEHAGSRFAQGALVKRIAGGR
jgi:predicted Zn-dependent protease